MRRASSWDRSLPQIYHSDEVVPYTSQASLFSLGRQTSLLVGQLSWLVAYPAYCVRGGAPSSSLSSSPPR